MWIAIQNAVGARQGVGGGPTPPPYTPPLDAYPATAAYSVRRLRTDYSGAPIEAYRVSDGATQDIQFDSQGLLDTTELTTFASGGEVRVRTWYDQMENGYDAVGVLDSEYPVIFDGTNVILDGANPALRFNPTNNTGLQISPDITLSGNLLIVALATTDGSAGANTLTIFYANTNYTTVGAGISDRGGATNPLITGWSVPPNNTGNTSTVAARTQLGMPHIRAYSVVSSVPTINSDGVAGALTSSWTPFTGTFIGRRSDGLLEYWGNMQEIMVWDTAQAAAIPTLEGNINSYYQVANLPDYTSGFLADYSGAAAAYSVRKLSNTAIKCMRVRRTVSPFDEQDIGFDSNGELDTAAITTFGGSDVLVVSRWYDQSGFSRHAVQPTPGNQPQIYDGVAVITENGKPIIKAIDTTDGFDSVSFSPIAIGDPFSVFSVSRAETSISMMVYFDVPPTSAPNERIYTSQSGSASSDGLVSGFTLSGATFNWNGISQSSPKTRDDAYNQFFQNQTLASAVNLKPGATYGDISSFRLSQAQSYYRMHSMQEFILYPSDKNAAGETAAIEENTNDYYYAYNTSGFVVDYPGAIAAYSVRQLGNRQRYAMRVRRLGGAADYLDVGFVAGELDTQAIIDFGGSDTLGVEVWYDQSRSGNDVTNTSTTTMPIIYNGSSVITDGGKPALGRNSAGLYYSIGNIVPVGVTQASFISVVQGPDAGTLTRTWHGSGGGSLNSLTTGNNLYIYNGGSPQFGSGPAVGRTLGIQLTDGNPGAAEKGWRNGVLNYSADSGPNSPRTNIFGSTTLAQTPLFMQEMILYPSDIDAGGTRINIETNINTYYGIY